MITFYLCLYMHLYTSVVLFIFSPILLLILYYPEHQRSSTSVSRYFSKFHKIYQNAWIMSNTLCCRSLNVRFKIYKTFYCFCTFHNKLEYWYSMKIDVFKKEQHFIVFLELQLSKTKETNIVFLKHWQHFKNTYIIASPKR